MIKIIAALSENKVIGNKGKIPWLIKEDLERFRKAITGKVIVMGRKTYESLKEVYPSDFGHPLAGKNIILSRTLKLEGGYIYDELEIILKDFENEDLIIIGGGEVYKEFLDYAGELDLTRISGMYEGDSFFPEFENKFKKVSEEKGNEPRVIYEKWIKK